MSPSPERINAIFNPTLLAELKRIELRTRRRISADLAGRYRSAFRGSGLLYADLREYQPGDDVKSIHWRASARSGTVYVKSYEEERQRTVLLAVDVSRSTAIGAPRSKHHKTLEFAALVSTLAARSGDNIGLCLFSDRVREYLRPSKARSQLQRILLTLLSDQELDPATNIAAALDIIRERQRRNALIFVVSDFLTPPFEESLRWLSSGHEVVCVLVEDGSDESLPAAGLVEFEDPESGWRLTFDTSSPRARRALSEHRRARIAQLRELCLRSRADFVSFADNPLAPLRELMTRKIQRFV